MNTPVGNVVFDCTKSIPAGEWVPGALCKHPQAGVGKVVAVDAEAKTATVHFLFWVAMPGGECPVEREPGIIVEQSVCALLTPEEIHALRAVVDPLTVDDDANAGPWFPKHPLADQG